MGADAARRRARRASSATNGPTVRRGLPARAAGAALVLPDADAEAMHRASGRDRRAPVAPGAHAALVLDGAGWHRPAASSASPHNITLIPLPPYAPELNPVENVWEYLRGNKLAISALRRLRRHRRHLLRRPGTSSPTTQPSVASTTAPQLGERCRLRAVGIRRLSCSIDEADAVGLGDNRALAALGAEGRPVAALVLRHHERLDGSSYHRYAKAPDLSPAARILAAAEA